MNWNNGMVYMWQPGTSSNYILGVTKAFPRLIISARKLALGFGGLAYDCLDTIDFIDDFLNY